MKVSDVIEKKDTGYKAFLAVEIPGLLLNCEISYATMNSKDIKEQHKAIMKYKGKEVKRKKIGGGGSLAWCICKKDAKGKMVGDISQPLTEDEAEDIEAFQIKDGKEQAVEPFKKSLTIKVAKIAAKSFKDNFLLERTLEVWGEDGGALYKLAEFLDTKQSVALCSLVMTKGYDTQYLGMIEARFTEDGHFGLVMYCAKKKMEFNHLLSATMTKRQESAPESLGLLAEVLA
jgi:hypothetical protein